MAKIVPRKAVTLSAKDSQKSLPKPIRRKPSIFQNLFNFKFNFNFKKLGIFFAIVLTVIGISLIAYYFIVEYKIDRYQINELKYVERAKINTVLAGYTSNSLININSEALEQDILKSSIYVKKVKVSKSMISGIVLEIEENKPLIITKTTEGKLYLVTDDYKKIEIINEEIKDIPQIIFLSNDIDSPNFNSFLQKSLKAKAVELPNSEISFDNFGNLTILMEGDKIVRLDLNERFFTIDEQLTLLQDTLAKNSNFSEIDLRFNYLAIR